MTRSRKDNRLIKAMTDATEYVFNIEEAFNELCEIYAHRFKAGDEDHICDYCRLHKSHKIHTILK